MENTHAIFTIFRDKYKQIGTKFIATVLLTGLSALPLGCFAQDNDLTRIKQNFIRLQHTGKLVSEEPYSTLNRLAREQSLSDQMVVELFHRQATHPDTVRQYLNRQRTDGTWPDIDYKDQKRSGWEPRIHTERILELTKQYASAGSPFYRSEPVKSAIRKGLHYWFTRKPVCPNWWYNEIGVPKTLGSVFLLFEKELTETEKQSAIEVMEHSRFGMTGQNKVWLAGNVLTRALLQNDAALVRAARDTIVSEIVTGQKEGIQPDWSFHQHGTQQQFGNYGLAFLASMSFYSGVFAGTSMAFDEPQLEIVRRLVDEGYRWILWKGMMDISSLGRQFFKEAQVHKGLSTTFAALELGGGNSPACNATAQQLCLENYHKAPKHVLTGHRHFYCSNYTVHRRPTWMASVKMASRRVCGTENMNGDNMKGFYIADGATYVYQDGREYMDIFPLWDWRKLPGVTAYDKEGAIPVRQVRNNSDFVGGLSDGTHGMTVMELDRNGLKAQKAWIFTDRFILCLGTGISTDSTLTVTTAMEQCHRRDTLYALQEKKWQPIVRLSENGQREMRFYHHRTGYVCWGEDMQATAEVASRTGQWHDIMQMYPEGNTQGEVVQLCLKHGQAPRNASYRYLILPDAEKDEVAAFNLNTFRILRNDRQMQAVALDDGSHWIAVLQPGEMMLADRTRVELKTPGIYKVYRKGNEYAALWSSPSQQARQAELFIEGQGKLTVTDACF